MKRKWTEESAVSFLKKKGAIANIEEERVVDHKNNVIMVYKVFTLTVEKGTLSLAAGGAFDFLKKRMFLRKTKHGFILRGSPIKISENSILQNEEEL